MEMFVLLGRQIVFLSYMCISTSLAPILIWGPYFTRGYQIASEMGPGRDPFKEGPISLPHRHKNFNTNHTNTRGKGFYRGLGNTVSEQVLAGFSMRLHDHMLCKAFVSTSGLPLHAIAGSMNSINTYCFCTGWLL